MSLEAISSPYPNTPTQADRIASSESRTSVFECILLGLAILILPAEEFFPSFGGFSSSFLLFILMAAHVACFHPAVLMRTAGHAVLAPLWALVAFGFLIESLHPYSEYGEIVRIAQMVAGALLIACLCRDRKALWTVFGSYVLTGIWMAFVLIMTMYSGLSKATANDFGEASKVRSEVLEANPLAGNANEMAFLTGQGAVVALALALGTRSKVLQCILYMAGGFCAIATFLPLSRSGIAITVISCGAVMLTFKGKRMKVLFGGAVLAIAIASAVPEVVYSRLTFTTETSQGRQEARAAVYTAAFQNLPEYIVAGVGIGNFWRLWGYNHGWLGGHGVVGAHNSFIQAALYWGVVGLTLMLVAIWRSFRALPPGPGSEVLSLALFGVAISLFLFLFVSHMLYAKQLSIGLGIIAGANRWIWPVKTSASSSRATGKVVSRDSN